MKEIKHFVKLKVQAKKASPAPPIGSTLGPSGINISDFCKDFNEWTKDLEGMVEFGVLIYNDFSYDLLTKEEVKRYDRGQVHEVFSYLYKDEEDKLFKFADVNPLDENYNYQDEYNKPKSR